MTNCTERYPSHESYDPDSLISLGFAICKEPVLIIPFVIMSFVIIWMLSSCCGRKKYSSYHHTRN